MTALSGLILGPVRPAVFAWGLVPRAMRPKVAWILILRLSLVPLDLIGVALLAALLARVSAIAFGGASFADAGQASASIPVVGEVPLAPLAGFTLGLYIVRAGYALAITRWSLRRLADVDAAVTSTIAWWFFVSASASLRARYSTQHLSNSLSGMIGSAVSSPLGNFAMVVQDLTLLSVLLVTMSIAAPLATAFTATIGLLAFLIIHRWLGRRVARLSEASSRETIRGHRIIQELVLGYEEVTALRQQQQAADAIYQQRARTLQIDALNGFLPQVPRYIYETAVVIIIAGVLLLQALSGGSWTALGGGALALFLVSVARFVPSLLTLQQTLAELRSAWGSTAPLREIVSLLRESTGPSTDRPMPASAAAAGRSVPRPVPGSADEPAVAPVEAGPALSLTAVWFQYAPDLPPALRDVTLSVPYGEHHALIGPSGAGKSTLVRLALGLLEPTRGTVRLAGIAIGEQPLPVVGYVPQRPTLLNATVMENIAFCQRREEWQPDRALAALEAVGLAGELTPRGDDLLDMWAGEGGAAMSGGQRQRLGIARALYAGSRLLVLDEATSALDAPAEALVRDVVRSMGATVAVLTVAHRLSTVQDAHAVIYLSAGEVRGVGTLRDLARRFAYVRQAVETMSLRGVLD
ncbi:MAG: ABC transporter ATP-binding protein/permease [Actinomycetales bacterium]|nr:ABC transporter ATP-binding protein/permease [Actinomycetales bacterium]